MKAAACSCRVTISSILEPCNDSTTSRFSSPGTPKIRSTPSFSRALTRRSEPFIFGVLIGLIDTTSQPNMEYRNVEMAQLPPRIVFEKMGRHGGRPSLKQTNSSLRVPGVDVWQAKNLRADRGYRSDSFHRASPRNSPA